MILKNKTILIMIKTLLVILAFACATTRPVVSDRPVVDDQEVAYLKDFYQHLHQNPEISLQEEKTSELLATELEKVGYTVTRRVGGYGIVGIIKNGDGPQVLYRTDMDALPMIEKTDLPYASKITAISNGVEVGTMHSCGHDMHMTTWLGTARYLANNKDKWKGTIMLIGQPAEEIGAGAKMMLDAGLYDRFGVPDYGLGLHCNPTILAGQVGMTDGFTMANTESIDIKVHGIGAHGASPHMSVDPVVIASMMVMELQTIVSRSLKPTESAVVTVGAIKGGTKHNIISDNVTLQLTVRTYTEEVRQMVHKRIREIARGVAIAAGLPDDKMPEVQIPDEYTPANYNDPEMTAMVQAAAAKAIGAESVIYAEPQMTGEDFSRYGRTEHDVPTVLYWLGTATPEKLAADHIPGLHSPHYFPEIETTMKTGISVTSSMIMSLLNG